MRKLTLPASTAIGIVIGGVLFNATPAQADLPTIDATVLAAVNAVKGVLSDINGYIQDVKDFLSATGPIASLLGDNTFGTVEQLLQEGFTQTANYQKASVGALEQILDASNSANARFKRDVRNAQIRDEQTPNPTACIALDRCRRHALQRGGPGDVADAPFRLDLQHLQPRAVGLRRQPDVCQVLLLQRRQRY